MAKETARYRPRSPGFVIGCGACARYGRLTASEREIVGEMLNLVKCQPPAADVIPPESITFFTAGGPCREVFSLPQIGSLGIRDKPVLGWVIPRSGEVSPTDDRKPSSTPRWLPSPTFERKV